jgi:hypothetical protein
MLAPHEFSYGIDGKAQSDFPLYPFLNDFGTADDALRGWSLLRRTGIANRPAAGWLDAASRTAHVPDE